MLGGRPGMAIGMVDTDVILRTCGGSTIDRGGDYRVGTVRRNENGGGS